MRLVISSNLFCGMRPDIGGMSCKQFCICCESNDEWVSDGPCSVWLLTVRDWKKAGMKVTFMGRSMYFSLTVKSCSYRTLDCVSHPPVSVCIVMKRSTAHIPYMTLVHIQYWPLVHMHVRMIRINLYFWEACWNEISAGRVGRVAMQSKSF